jgi:hypothetical protein
VLAALGLVVPPRRRDLVRLVPVRPVSRPTTCTGTACEAASLVISFESA